MMMALPIGGSRFTDRGRLSSGGSSTIQPTIMRKVEHNTRVMDVIDRRIRYAPANNLQNAFGFEKFGTRLWSCPDYEIVSVGTSAYLRQCDLLFNQYKNPFPGVIDTKELANGAMALSNSRMNSVTNSKFIGSQALVLGKDVSCLMAKVDIQSSPYKFNMFIDLALIISFGDSLKEENSYTEIEIMIARGLLSRPK